MLNKTTDIIITTYNRATRVYELVLQLLLITNENVKIIVVDSSDIVNFSLLKIGKICYLRSSHKNQPYQRYLGYLASKAEILIFLDDDMEIVEREFVDIVGELFENDVVSGVAIKFGDKEKDTSLSKIPSTRFFLRDNHIKEIKGWLTGYPKLPQGKFGFCGNRGAQPKEGGMTEWVSGGAFAARRSAIFQNFNFQLMDIFEKHLGMGEDGIIGYGLSKMGELFYHDELMFLHNDQKDSSYVTDIYDFTKRVAFSRLYLSLEKARLNHESKLFAIVHYHYFMFWRILGLLLNLIVTPSLTKLKVVKGTLSGWFKAVFFEHSMSHNHHEYWNSEALRDISMLAQDSPIIG